jgi:hypothetical protein
VVTSYAVAPAGEYNVETGGQLGQYTFQVHDPETEDILARLNGNGGLLMPKVGKRKFPYTKKGKKVAASYAKKTGKKVRRTGY